MQWEDSENLAIRKIPNDIQDLSFRITAKMLPLDHAEKLSEAIQEKLPWIREQENAGIHLINYPESGNAWSRGDDSPDENFFVSRRSRLRLRLPRQRIIDSQILSGQNLDINGNKVSVGESTALPLSRSTTLFARKIIFDVDETEAAFVQRLLAEMEAMDIIPPKLLCGKHKYLQLHGKNISVCSVMLADLEFDASIRLQQRGLGPGRLYGCGLFIPHKGISSTNLED